MIINSKKIYAFLVYLTIFVRLLQGTYGAFNGTAPFYTFCSITRYFIVICLGLLFLSNGKLTLWKILLSVVVAASFAFSPAKALIVGLMFVLAFPRELKLKRVVKHAGYLILLYLMFAIFLSQVGLLVDLANTRAGTMRHSLGFVTPSGCSAFYTAAVLCITYADFQRMKYKNMIGFLTVELVIYLITGTRIGLVLMALYTVMCCACISSKKHKQHVMHFMDYCIFPSFLVCAMTSLWVSIHFGKMHAGKYNDPLYWAIDSIFSGRVYYMSEYYDRYGIHFFGSKTELVGSIEKISTGTHWFGVDNSYIYILVTFGVVGLLLFGVIFYLLAREALQTHDTAKSLYLIIFAIFGVTEAVFTDLPYSLLFLFMGEYVTNHAMKRVWEKAVVTNNMSPVGRTNKI